MNKLIQNLFAALERSAQRMREREIERYLGEAADAADLENRLRRLERAWLRRELGHVAK